MLLQGEDKSFSAEVRSSLQLCQEGLKQYKLDNMADVTKDLIPVVQVGEIAWLGLADFERVLMPKALLKLVPRQMREAILMGVTENMIVIGIELSELEKLVLANKF